MKFNSFTKWKNLKKPFLFFMLSFFTFFSTFSQDTGTINISGRVVDKKTGEEIIGASAIIKGAPTGTMTDLMGNFELTVPVNSTLTVSYIGYKTQEIPITSDKTKLTIGLEEDTELLDEVVVIGYGQVRKGDATGSILSLKPDELNKGLQVNAEDALVGKIAGVNIVPGSGAPGSGGTIRIRMGASLTANNDPLMVIDGIPVSDTSINSINPNDIASFTVLKDASATAIYGSRASNGVIIITTKKGNAGGASKPRVSYSSNFSVSSPPEHLDFLSVSEFRTAFSDYVGDNENAKLGSASTNWQKQIYRTAFGTDHNVSVTGATKQMPYRVSVGYINQNGVIKENNYQRLNASIGLSPKFFDKHLSLDINVKGSLEWNKPVSTGVIGSAASFDPTRPVYENYPNNVGLGYYMWMKDGVPTVLAATNPVADLKLTDKLDKTNRSIGNVSMDYKIHGFEDLHLNMNVGYDISKNTYEEKIPDNAPSTYTGNKNDGRGKLYNRERHNKNYLFDLYANYIKDVTDKQNINAMVGYGWQRFWYDKNESTYDRNNNELAVPTFNEEELYLLSFYGRLNYTFDNKLFLTSTLRADASSRFAKNKRWGYFPSVALGYRLTEESFMKNFNALSDLKLRLSYGQTGQQDVSGYYPHLGTYTASYDDARYLFGDQWLTMYRPNGFDPNIKWETTSTYNFGIDYGFLNNRIYGSVDVYTRRTNDLLNKIAVPAGSNFTNLITTNIGNMKSSGVELAVSGVPVKTKDLEWTISGNFTYATSEITKLNTIDTESNYVKTGSAGGTGKYLQVQKVGETPYTFFLLKQAYDENGKPLDGKYIAKDGSITTSEEDANKYVTGKSSQTPYYYGMSTRLIYQDWDFGINGHGGFGNYVFNYQDGKQSLESLYGGTGVSSNMSKAAYRNGFTKERTYSDHFLERGSFFKIDNITLGYTINKLWNTESALRLAFSVQNLCTITSYSGVDPEIYSGIDNNVYQRPRIYTLSLNLNF